MTGRRYSNRAFPGYAYRPGRDPHPLRDPAGHSYGEFARPAVPALDPQRWWASEEYLYGIDLFNHGYYWEAHEALEGLWVEAGRDTELGRGLQGLIQLAVGQLKWSLAHAEAARTLTREGWAKLPRTGSWLGIDLVQLRLDIEAMFTGAAEAPRITLALPDAAAGS